VVRLQWVGANPHPEVTGIDPLPGVTNYFKGNDPTKWVTHVPSYGQVSYKDLYPGIDLLYYGNAAHQLEYDFRVAPGADPGRVQLAFAGADAVQTDAQGNLVLHTSAGDVTEHAPTLYQEGNGGRQTVAGRYVVQDAAHVGFQVGAYDRDRPLVIDPALSY